MASTPQEIARDIVVANVALSAGMLSGDELAKMYREVLKGVTDGDKLGAFAKANAKNAADAAG